MFFFYSADLSVAVVYLFELKFGVSFCSILFFFSFISGVTSLDVDWLPEVRDDRESVDSARITFLAGLMFMGLFDTICSFLISLPLFDTDTDLDLLGLSVADIKESD